MERTLILVKPDGVRRALVGEVIRRFEARGLRLAALKMVLAGKDLVEKHYEEHREKPFYGSLVEYLTSGPVVAMVIEGPNAVQASRTMMGATNALEAAPGTIRGDFALSIEENIVHGSATPEDAQREVALWFSPDEIVS
ncbi:MAG: nucleoside-diphosphate kinase [Armatimonadetes bacterium]|nr:MAG: nucleoside-diphosphate kinase [Armatimonadota bacterium]